MGLRRHPPLGHGHENERAQRPGFESSVCRSEAAGPLAGAAQLLSPRHQRQVPRWEAELRLCQPPPRTAGPEQSHAEAGAGGTLACPPARATEPHARRLLRLLNALSASRASECLATAASSRRAAPRLRQTRTRDWDTFLVFPKVTGELRGPGGDALDPGPGRSALPSVRGYSHDSLLGEAQWTDDKQMTALLGTAAQHALGTSCAPRSAERPAQNA